jgi:hypothetical protein
MRGSVESFAYYVVVDLPNIWHWFWIMGGWFQNLWGFLQIIVKGFFAQIFIHLGAIGFLYSLQLGQGFSV